MSFSNKLKLRRSFGRTATALAGAGILTLAASCSATQKTDARLNEAEIHKTEKPEMELAQLDIENIGSDRDLYARLDSNKVIPPMQILKYSRYAEIPNFREQIIAFRLYELNADYTNASSTHRNILAQAKAIYGVNDVRCIELLMPLVAMIGRESKYQDMVDNLKEYETLIQTSELSPQFRSLILAARASALSGLGDQDRAESYADEAIKLIGEKKDDISLALIGDIYFTKGVIRHFQGKNVEGAKFVQESLDYREQVVGPDNYIIASNKMAIAGMLSHARDPRAMPLARDALETAERILPSNHLDLAKAMEVMGLELQRSGYTYQAAELFPKAIEIKAKSLGFDHLLVAYAMNNLASLQSGIGRHERSIELYLRARDGFLKNQGEESFMAANAARSAASGMLRIGKPYEALEYREEAHLIIDKKLPITHQDNYRARIGLVDNYLALERYEDAKFQAEKVVEGARQALPPEHEDYIIADVYMAAANYFSAALPLDKDQAAVTIYDAVDRLVENAQQRYEIGVGQFFQPLTRAAISQGLRVAIEQNNPDRAAKYLQLRNQSTLGGAVGDILDREKAKDDNLKGLVRNKQDALESFKSAERAYYKGFSSRDNDLANLKTVYDTTQQKVTKISNEINKLFPDYVATGQNQLFSLSEIQSALTEDETVLLLDGTNADLYVMAISGAKQAMAYIPFGTSQMEEYVESISKTIAPSTPFDIKASSALYNLIFSEPIESIITDSDDGHIKILVNGVLSNIPFSYLRSSEETGRYLIQDSALSVLPSIGSLFTSSHHGASISSSFLGVGDPILTYKEAEQKIAPSQIPPDFRGGNGVLYRGGKLDNGALFQFPELPRTREELKEISRNFKTSKLLLGKNANEENLKSMDLSQYSLIAFATHGVVADEVLGQGEPGLVLTPPALKNGEKNLTELDNGYLTASEILSFDLNADWIVLSACNTAAGQSRGASAYTGLTRSFIYAGADALLVSHWPVRDDAAAFLTVNTVNNTQAGMSKAQALRKAMNDLRNNSAISNADHPLIWAPFVLVAN